MTNIPHIFLCNNAQLPEDWSISNNVKYLEYRFDSTNKKNINLTLPDFVRNVYYLPPRVKDLLEIASYIYAADRTSSRGNKDAREYHSWSRKMYLAIKIRDFNFWNSQTVNEYLINALNFMTGDLEYKFNFQPGHDPQKTSLFDSEEFQIEPKTETDILLFSGGLDSLTGAVELLETTDHQVCFISHRSYQPQSAKTQDRLCDSLKSIYANRIKHYKFYCSLKGKRAIEESQRSRGFLYTSIAFSLAHALSQNIFYVHENGITSINLPRRQDLMNARASRTTHPQTLFWLEKLFSLVHESKFNIKHPFLWLTKTDVLQKIKRFKREELISSAVSCSKTFQNLEQATHCGGCLQCVDRRFAAYSSNLEEFDHSGLYNLNFISDEIEDGEVRTTLVDYVRQANEFATWNIDHFYLKNLSELTNIIDYLNGESEELNIDKIWSLCKKHGQQVISAIKRMQLMHEDLSKRINEKSLLNLIDRRDYLKEPVDLLVERITNRLNMAIPISFKKNKPKNENDLNDKIQAILFGMDVDLESEFPAISFALAKTIPDHSLLKNYNLLIETKYVRGKTTPSKITDGIAADLTKYPAECIKLFCIYDPERSIYNDEKFRKDFESKGNCVINIIR